MKVLLTRPSGKNQKLQSLLSARGFQVEVLPVIQLVTLHSAEEIKQSWERWSATEVASRYVVITSGHTVELLRETGIVIDIPVACVGIGTAAAARHAGWDVCYSGAHDAQGLVDQLAPSVRGAAIWWPGSAKADPGLADRLKEHGASVTRISLYQPQATSAGLAALVAQLVPDAVVFYSASAVDAFAGALANTLIWPAHTAAVCVGETTAAAARRCDFARVVVAGEPADEAVVDAISATHGFLSAMMSASHRESHSE